MSSLTIRQQSNHSGWPKAAELIEIQGAHGLEASDRALMNTLLQHAHDSGRLTESDAEWEISFAHLRHCQSRHESNDRIRESLKRIRRIEVKITYTTESGERRELESSLLTFTDTSLEDTANATVQFGIPARLRRILARSNRWGRIRCEIGYAMSSKYAVALYEMICLRSNLDHCFETIDMQRFRDLLGVPPGTYDRADNFMRNVVMPATREVNGLSDTGVRIDLMRKHPRATAHAVTICWWRMSPETFQTAANTPGAIMENKRLGAALALVKARQDTYAPNRRRHDQAQRRPPNNLEAPGLPSESRPRRGGRPDC